MNELKAPLAIVSYHYMCFPLTTVVMTSPLHHHYYCGVLKDSIVFGMNEITAGGIVIY